MNQIRHTQTTNRDCYILRKVNVLAAIDWPLGVVFKPLQLITKLLEQTQWYLAEIF